MKYDEYFDFIAPEWLLEGLQVLRPAGKELVSEWADRCRVLDGNSALPGKWRTSFTPYLKAIMDSFNDTEVEEISIIKPTQVGGTEVMLNILGYIIDCDPGPTMIVYPIKDLAEMASKKRVQGMINSTPALKRRFDSSSPLLALEFDAMSVILAGANSPSSLASHPIRYLIMDETDKYPNFAGKEANPRSLARERTKTYSSNKKIISASTPTFESGPIWDDWKNADMQLELFVACPHCNATWTWEFKHLKFSTESAEKARETAVYICKECGGLISDKEKPEMMRVCEWRAVKNVGKRKIAFRFNTFSSPWTRFGDIAYEFVTSKNDPAKLMNFINSWLAEPYKEVESSVSGEWIHCNRQSAYDEGILPPGTVLLTAGVDVQKKSFFFTIRAWLENMTSFNICHGEAYSWREIETIMNRGYYSTDKKEYFVNLCCVDSGDQTDDVYDFCAKNAQWAVPIKGASTKINGRFKRSVIDKADSKANGTTLYIVDTNHYKDVIFARLKRDEDDGGWYVFNDCDADYCEMIASEHKVLKRYNGRITSVWDLKSSGRGNHYLDCEVYAMLGADLIGIRDLKAQKEASEATAAESNPMPLAPPKRYNNKRSWFSR